MLDSSAPVVPGQRAAGVVLGSPMADVLGAVPEITFRMEPVHDAAGQRTRQRVYRSVMVDLWEGDGRVVQVRVHGPYAGRCLGRIGIGSTLAEVEAELGPVVENADGDYMIADVPGLLIQADQADAGADIETDAQHAARIAALVVHEP